MTASIIIKTDLLLAVSRWAAPHGDNRPHISVVLFKGNEMVAVDGHRLVRVPVACNGLTIAVDREHIAAAAAAQAFCRDGMYRDEDWGGSSAVEITQAKGRVSISVGRIAVTAPAGDPTTFPPIDQVMPKERPESRPDGYGFNPKYLAAIDDVETAAGAAPGQRGVKITGWSADGFGPMLFEGYMGIRYVVMPVRV